MTFTKKQSDRRLMVKRIEELTGIKARYLFMPTCGFQIGGYIVTKEGNLETDKPDMSLILQLAKEGFIIYEDNKNKMEEDTIEESTKINISFPMEQHSGVSLRNMLNLIHSRGKLLTKATGYEFSVSDGLIEAVKDDNCIISKETFMRAVADYETGHGKSIFGIVLTPEKLTFTVLAHTDADHTDAFIKLASLMNMQAIMQKRIQSKAVVDENEKYAMRTWLIRIGMVGDEYKSARRILMENLSGHTAFRTQADAERAKQKLTEKRRQSVAVE